MPDAMVTNPNTLSPFMGLQHLASLYSIWLIFSSMTRASVDRGAVAAASIFFCSALRSSASAAAVRRSSSARPETQCSRISFIVRKSTFCSAIIEYTSRPVRTLK